MGLVHAHLLGAQARSRAIWHAHQMPRLLLSGEQSHCHDGGLSQCECQPIMHARGRPLSAPFCASCHERELCQRERLSVHRNTKTPNMPLRSNPQNKASGSVVLEVPNSRHVILVFASLAISRLARPAHARFYGML